MNEKTFKVLEYQKIKDMLMSEAASVMTKKRIAEMSPSLELTEIKEMQAETTEAVSVIMHKGAPSFGGFYDISGAVNLASKGGVLMMKQLLEVLYNLHTARHASQFLQSDLPPLPRVRGLAEVLSVQKKIEEEIDRCILSEDEMADSASSELKSIRRKIALQNEAVRSKMNSILTSADQKNLLQDSIITMRQGRYVIPVKQEHKQKFPGIVHDQSATGATFFIEPQAIVDMNNELRELELAEKKEMHRILSELSAMVGDVAEEIKNNQKILVKLDYIFAKGKLSVRMKGEEPEMNAGGLLRIRDARHPLIDPKKVVPVSVSIGAEYDTLIVTGPNTGGKTVTLKIVGLMVLMAQSGLHLPASSGTTMPIFRQVFADIGDEQSIEQSLSTFSSHMANIVEIVKVAGEETLVLLDELGAGTDPTEGAALAISILNDLYGKGAKTFATTHYTELKKYAISTYGVQNASMEFNVETLSPTYHLTIGTPGKSNAFEISKKLGLPSSLIEYARSLLEHNDIAFEDVITSIEKDRKAAEEERDEAIALKREILRKREEIEAEREKIAEQKRTLIAKAKEEARDTIAEAREFAEQIKKELRELERNPDPADRNRKQEQLRKNLRETGEKYNEKITPPVNLSPVKPAELSLGDTVKVLSLDQIGEVMSLPDDRNEINVQIGLMKINVNIKNVTRISGKQAKKIRKSGSSGFAQSKIRDIVPSITVVGQVLDDAVMNVDKYLD
ncbi:MAG: endonuclease MutS2, partial [Eubacteriales bacterium]|nr:endonuclease MutS2 [Eubacteriales bacterium]